VRALRALFVGLSLTSLLAAAGASAVSAKDAKIKPAPAAAPSPPPANSTIYIIRQKALTLFSMSFEVMVDNQKAGELTNGTYVVVRRPPGHHTVLIPGGGLNSGMENTLDTVGGRTYFIEFGPGGSGLAPGMQLAVSLVQRGAGLRGTPLAGGGPTATFYLLDEKDGPERIDGLKNVTP
jgi:Protein of unknown function (DUF2846)